MNYKLFFNKHFHPINLKQSLKKKLANTSLVLLLLFSIFFNISAANILVWHFDPDNLDLYLDPEIGQEIRSDYWLKEYLTNNAYTYDYHSDTLLPADISSYDVIVGTFGWHEC